MPKSIYSEATENELLSIEECKKLYATYDDIKDAINTFVWADGYTHEYEKIGEFLKIAVDKHYLSQLDAVTMFFYATNTWDITNDHNLVPLRQSVMDLYYKNYEIVSAFSNMLECLRWLLSYRMAKVYFVRRLKRNLKCLAKPQ